MAEPWDFLFRESIRVTIENWPAAQPWYLEWGPLLLTSIAVVTAIGALIWSVRQHKQIMNWYFEQHEQATRPYVWLTNWATQAEGHMPHAVLGNM